MLVQINVFQGIFGLKITLLSRRKRNAKQDIPVNINVLRWLTLNKINFFFFSSIKASNAESLPVLFSSRFLLMIYLL